jgi:hypothetical protein
MARWWDWLTVSHSGPFPFLQVSVHGDERCDSSGTWETATSRGGTVSLLVLRQPAGSAETGIVAAFP